MIEWTLCKNCKKLLDSNQKSCPFCGSEVEVYHIDYHRLFKKYAFEINFFHKCIRQ